MKKNIYFIDIWPMNASKILETLGVYLEDREIEADLKMILVNINNFTNIDDVEYYQKLCSNLGISFDHIKVFENLKTTVSCIDSKNSLVLLNPLMDETIFYFCRNILNSMNIKFELVATCPWYEKETEYNSKIEQFKEIYKQNIGEVAPEIFAGQNLRTNNFVEADAKKLLVLE